MLDDDDDDDSQNVNRWASVLKLMDKYKGRAIYFLLSVLVI